ncbi:MAG: succinate dehydrogenase cytochrome b subunit [Acidimicrobiia bacterium]
MAQVTASTDTVRPINKRAKQLPFPLNIYQSAVGKKWVMAITGIAILGFVLAHMIGNLKLYLGVEPMNHYAEWLRDMLTPILPRTVALWLMRIGLIVAFALHIHSAYSLTIMNAKARPNGYQSKRDYIAANFASRTMRASGIIVGLFILWHLADLTWGFVNPDFIRGDAYHNVVESFSFFPVAALYIVANLALGLHIYHGAWSLFQSLGANSPKLNPMRRPFAVAFAALIVVGNLSFPIMVQAGVISEKNRTTPLVNTETANEDAATTLVINLSETAQ